MLRRTVGMIAVVVGGIVCLYLGWGAHRLSGPWPADWPQPLPYPDRWLLALNAYYEAKYPVAGPYIKMHGEWPRVMRDVSCAMLAGAITCVAGLAVLVSPMVWRAVQSRKRGFEVAPRSDRSSAR